jgi:DNA-binding winged helix-turn-helix (wHTH) protein
MNVANVTSFGASRELPPARSARPVARIPLCVRFAAFRLDEANALLLCNEKVITLAPRPFGVLCALARQPGCLLTKHALLDEVWGHQFVTDSVLKTAVSEVRAALDDDPKQPRYIETVSRRGYRFIAASSGASSQRESAIGRNVAAGHDHPALAALAALCRGDAALADLICSLAAALQREPQMLVES